MFDSRETPVFAGMVVDTLAGRVPGLAPLTPDRMHELGIVRDATERNQATMVPIAGVLIPRSHPIVITAGGGDKTGDDPAPTKPVNPRPTAKGRSTKGRQKTEENDA